MLYEVITGHRLGCAALRQIGRFPLGVDTVPVADLHVAEAGAQQRLLALGHLQGGGP